MLFRSGGITLSDDIVKAKSGGVMIGYDALDGRIPGCYQYDNYVTIIVKAVFDTEYTIEQKVRLAGGGKDDWADTVNAKVGDVIEFRIGYENTSGESQTDVVIKDILPANLEYIAGSSVIKNSNHPDGDKIIQDSVVTEGIRIGSYAADANAYIYFQAKVVNRGLKQGLNMLTNWAQVGVDDITMQNSTEIRIQNTKKHCMVLAAYCAAITACMIIIVILLRMIVKRNMLNKTIKKK